MELKNRSEMDSRYTWDLTPIFESDEAWENALKEASEAVAKLQQLPGTLGASVDALKNGLDQVFSVSQQMEKLYCYAFLRDRKSVV